MRIAFATNDERTAKRVSEALGTATELRAQKNYAGHRLAPWLAHMMVSRQETSRPLLTPGEIMQLPSGDELVMVSGVPPVRAQKLRYYADRNFVDRVRASAPKQISLRSSRDEWSDTCVADAKGDGSRRSGGERSDGGLETVPELSLASELRSRDVASDEQPDLDDTQDAGDADHLDAVRRAVAMDRGDKDMLPDF